jgi:hypothetical protein
MKTNHNTPSTIGPCQVVKDARIPTSLAEFHRDISGMHQEIEPRESETAFWEEIKVLRSPRGRSWSITRD